MPELNETNMSPIDAYRIIIVAAEQWRDELDQTVIPEMGHGGRDSAVLEYEGKLAQVRQALNVLTFAPQPAFGETTEELARYHRLHDRLSDMIESGRLGRGDIPDDYDWLMELLAAQNASIGSVAGVQAFFGANGPWADHPVFDWEDWRDEVANGDTRRSYADWCLAQAEQRESDEQAQTRDDMQS